MEEYRDNYEGRSVAHRQAVASVKSRMPIIVRQIRFVLIVASAGSKESPSNLLRTAPLKSSKYKTWRDNEEAITQRSLRIKMGDSVLIWFVPSEQHMESPQVHVCSENGISQCDVPKLCNSR